jgi:hypothetical protein
MARYKYIDTNPRFLAVDLARQLLPGTFEHALNHLLDHAIDLSHFRRTLSEWRDGGAGVSTRDAVEGGAVRVFAGHRQQPRDRTGLPGARDVHRAVWGQRPAFHDDRSLREQASDAHRAATKRAELEDYQMRDQRHSYAVRAARAGTPAELIARQLGHANAVLVLKVYGRFMPSQQDRDKWEKLADLQDQESAAACTISCTTPRNEMSQLLVSDWPINSRGGTRTRDPGIMTEDAEPSDRDSSSDNAA